MILINGIVFSDEWLKSLYSMRRELHHKISFIRRHFNYTDRVYVKVFESTRHLADHFGFRIPEWIMATGFGDRLYLVKQEQGNDGFGGPILETILHELVHLAVAQSFSAQCPLWLNEGLALYYSGEYQSFDFSGCREEYPYYEKGYSDKDFYCQSAYVVARLIQRYRLWPFVAYCRKCTQFSQDPRVGVEGLRNIGAKAAP
ncbi:MAG: hypothetical protein FWG14_08405 [Peptococcaceae bacterium]|nr:hypothetical protein [Peptococcaceae bacterium]